MKIYQAHCIAEIKKTPLTHHLTINGTMLELGNDEPGTFFNFVRDTLIKKIRKFFDRHGLEFHYLYVFENPRAYGQEKIDIGSDTKWHVHILMHVPRPLSARIKKCIKTLIGNRSPYPNAARIKTYYEPKQRIYGPIYLLKGIGPRMPKSFFQIQNDGETRQIRKLDQGQVIGKRYGISRSLTPQTSTNQNLLNRHNLLPTTPSMSDEDAKSWLLEQASKQACSI